uniref:GPI ethanolamine phosphate transferase 1 n=1 Tax=Meloidogyne enterolobii TaxID=390850 RepID=A0A6V7VBJ5_MELEN|nr:unnamed protein product [Meloidogyne enterolobii]
MFIIFLFLGIFTHLLLLYSIFDIYYSSPIVKGGRNFKIIPSNSNNVLTPADRIVFFSADGLRASSFFDNPDVSPYIHSLIDGSKAVWGISESHVPTESRPGHVALFAGFYEDVSAVTRGWKHNPIPFDSTFNQSEFSFLWGSPDIINLFATNIPHSFSEFYSPELEDFASEEASKLDEWVFDKVEEFFNRAKQGNTKITKLLSIKRSIYFLHLLGLDTNGHGHKPNSKKYLENIKIVDKGIERIVNLFENYFNDKRTVYLFTSDHGMTDWGSHGDGTPDEVQTPFVAWGSGIAPTKTKINLTQVDIAPLQSALLGIAIPSNSFGIVPINLLGHLPDKYIFQSVYANFKQMSEQFLIRRAERRAHSFRFLFCEYPELSYEGLVKIENEIIRLAQLKRYEAAWKACIKLIPIIRSALNYFHRYNQFSQGLAICAIFCSWNLFLYASLIGKNSHLLLSSKQLYLPNEILFLILFITSTIIWANGWLLINYFYFLTPIYLFSISIKLLGNGEIFNLNKLFLIFVGLPFTVFSISLLVFVFFERFTLSLIFLLISPFWICKNIKNKQNFVKMKENDGIITNFKYSKHHNEFNSIRERQFRREQVFEEEEIFPTKFNVSNSVGDFNNNKWYWLILCILLSIFPLLDTVGNSQRPLLVIFAEFICCVFIFYLNYFKYFNQKLIVFIGILHLITFLIILFDYFELQLTTNNNLLKQLFAWINIPLSFILPLLWKQKIKTTKINLNIQLIIWSICLQLPFSLLSISHEALFLCLFSAFLNVYFQLELGKKILFFKKILLKRRGCLVF